MLSLGDGHLLVVAESVDRRRAGAPAAQLIAQVDALVVVLELIVSTTEASGCRRSRANAAAVVLAPAGLSGVGGVATAAEDPAIAVASTAPAVAADVLLLLAEKPPAREPELEKANCVPDVHVGEGV